MIDWSANSAPKQGKDSIWIGVGEWSFGTLAVRSPENPRTRLDARARITEILRNLAKEEKRVLVGFDFPYGYPSGFAAALKLKLNKLPPWRGVWDALSQAVQEAPRNVNNRFPAASDLNKRIGASQGPFWCCPPAAITQTLSVAKPVFPFPTPSGPTLHEFRLTEQHLRKRQATPHAVWQLYTAGSVGSQALLGIPTVASLCDVLSLKDFSLVWPFQTGFRSDPSPSHGPFILHAEIWPGAVAVDTSLHSVPDAAQVLSLVRHFASLDDQGRLGAAFDKPATMNDVTVRQCVDEEGWILGA